MVEKHYFGLKSGIDMDTMGTHNNKTSRGKFFVSFISLILRSYLLREKNLCKDKTFVHKSLPEIIRKMALIKLEQANRKITTHGIGKDQNRIISNLQVPIEFFKINIGGILEYLGISQPVVKRKVKNNK
jgi:transposase